MSEQLKDITVTVTPKSDQLNADDLIEPRILTVTGLEWSGSEDQPIWINYVGGEGRPYKPCKSMRRVLIKLWGKDATQWAGRQMEVYCDPLVKFGGSEVGGIRISRVSHIERDTVVTLTITRAKRAPYKIGRLDVRQREPYPADKFAETLPTVLETIKAGKMTAEQAIARLEKTGALTDEQRAAVRGDA